MTAVERIRAALDADVKGYGNLNHTWATDEDDDGNFGLHIVGANVDGELYPVLEIDTAQYFQETDAPKLAKYYAACNPAAMVEVLAHIDKLEAENQHLRAESEERLQNCAALVAEVERLRAEVTRPESTDMTLMRALVQSQATELERLRKDVERKPMYEGEIQAAWLGQGIEEPMPYTFELGIRSAERFNGIKGTP